MPDFNYEALNDQNQLTSGCESAESVSAAIVRLESLGLRVTSIQQVDLDSAQSSSDTDYRTPKEELTSENHQAFRQRVTAVLEKRELLLPALSAFAEEMPSGRSHRELQSIIQELNSVQTTDEVCNSEDRMAAWLPLVGFHEGSNYPWSEIFDEAAHENENRTQWIRTMMYPLFVILIAVAVFVFLCVIVVPTFQNIFEDFDLQLPFLTEVVLSISMLISRYPFTLLVSMLLGIIALYLLFRLLSSWGLPGRIWNALTKGNSLQVTAMARFVRRLAEALEAGITLPTALRLAGAAENRHQYRYIANQLAQDLVQKKRSLKDSPWAGLLPATVVHALQPGPEQEPNIPLLQQLAENYTARVSHRCKFSTGFTAQLAIVVLGITVGVVVLSLLLPLVHLINGLA